MPKKPKDWQQIAIEILSTNNVFNQGDIERVLKYNYKDMKLKREYIAFLKKVGFGAYQLQKAFGYKDKRNLVKMFKKV